MEDGVIQPVWRVGDNRIPRWLDIEEEEMICPRWLDIEEEEMICPMTSGYARHDDNCEKENCAWWIKEENECAMTLIARRMG